MSKKRAGVGDNLRKEKMMKMGTCLIMVLLSVCNILAEGETFQDILNYAREAYYDKGKYEECIKIIQEGIKKYPDDNQIVAGKSLLVSSYYKLGNYQEAIALLNILTREYPDYKDRSLWEYRKAYIGYKEENWQAAIGGFKQYLKDYPKEEREPFALYYISKIYKKLKNYNLAIEYANKFLKDYPNHDLAEKAELIIAHSLLREKQYEEAEKKYKEFINKHKESANLDRAYYFLGSCYAESAKWSRDKRELLKQALNYYSIVINDYSDSVWGHLATADIGYTYYRLSDYEQAIAYYKKYIKDEKSEKRLGNKLFFLGACYERLGNIDEAKKLYNRIIKNYPNTKWEEHAKKALKKI
jgi:TolA-binding protein